MALPRTPDEAVRAGKAIIAMMRDPKASRDFMDMISGKHSQFREAMNRPSRPVSSRFTWRLHPRPPRTDDMRQMLDDLATEGWRQ